jgi:hypothetical protein
MYGEVIEMRIISTEVDKDTLPALLEALDGVAGLPSFCEICEFTEASGEFNFIRVSISDPTELHLIDLQVGRVVTNDEFVRAITESVEETNRDQTNR